MGIVESLTKTTIEEIEKVLTTRTVVGEPITIEGITLIPLIAAGFAFGAGGGSGKGEAKQKGEGEGEYYGLKFSVSTIFPAFVMLVMAGALFESSGYPVGGRIYPWFVGSITFVLALSFLVTEIKRIRSGLSTETGASMDLEASDEPARQRYGGFAKSFGWVLGLCLSIWLLGFQIGISVLFILYLVFRARTRWFKVPILTAIMMLVLFYFDKFLGVFWPQGFLIQLLELPFF